MTHRTMTHRTMAQGTMTQAAALQDGPALRVEREDGQPLRACAEAALKQYLSELNGHTPSGLYQMVLEEIEYPLLKTVMDHTGGNQSRASEMLGINRSTLRKKLRLHGLDR